MRLSHSQLKNAEAINKGEKPVTELGVKAVDDYTLEVELEQAVPYFLNLVAFPIVLSIK